MTDPMKKRQLLTTTVRFCFTYWFSEHNQGKAFLPSRVDFPSKNESKKNAKKSFGFFWLRHWSYLFLSLSLWWWWSKQWAKEKEKEKERDKYSLIIIFHFLFSSSSSSSSRMMSVLEMLSNIRNSNALSRWHEQRSVTAWRHFSSDWQALLDLSKDRT